MNAKSTLNQKQSIFLIAGILLIAFNLRPALASLGPLVDSIHKETGLSNMALGLLTTLPLIAFGVISMFAPFFTRLFGIGKVLLFALILLTLGIVVRSLNWIPALYIGTLFLGVAIAFGNVLLPTLTKRNFSSKSGLITSLYSCVMAFGAAIAAGISVPLADAYNLGWRGSLRFWAIFSIVVVFLWLPQSWRLKRVRSGRNFSKEIIKMMQKPLAWKVALFMGLQSFTFYVMLAWLPTILIDRGYNTPNAGWMLSLGQATGILGSLTIPYFAGKKKDQTSIVILLTVLEILSFLGLLFSALGSEWIWVSINGYVLGGTFGLSLLFLVLRSSTTEVTTELSGMAQSFGYLIAAIGPVSIGSLFDLTNSWSFPLMVLLLITFIKLIMGLGAAKPETI